jgi:hypothetical protein
MKIKKFDFVSVFIILLLVLFLFFELYFSYLIWGKEGLKNTVISLFIITTILWKRLDN